MKLYVFNISNMCVYVLFFLFWHFLINNLLKSKNLKNLRTPIPLYEVQRDGLDCHCSTLHLVDHLSFKLR